jgi:exosortase N
MLAANIKLPEIKLKITVIALLVIYMVLFTITLNTYIHWQSVNFITGLLALPVVANVSAGNMSYRYGVVAILFAVIAMLLPVNTILYFTFLFAVLFVIESYYGKTNIFIPVILVFLSPVFQYFINVFSFPIRLQLTAWAGSIMNSIGMDNVVQGNMILHKGNEFSVDPACMGLNMLQLSFIVGVVLMAHFRQRTSKNFSWTGIALVFSMVLLLNVIANLLRMICIVQFTILPETLLHDITGLVFFLAYIILPLYFLVKKMASRIKTGKKTDQHRTVRSMPAKKIWSINLLLLILLSISSFKNIELKDRPVENWGTTPCVKGYTVQCLPQQVLKLEKKGSLVYIKKIPAFYNADHTPYICWRGSGYSFQHIEKQLIGTYMVYAGKLKKDKDELFTAWWYQSREKSTVNQFSWRWDMLMGKGNYYVMNVTTSNREDLVREVGTILNDHPFSHLVN